MCAIIFVCATSISLECEKRSQKLCLGKERDVTKLM